MKTQVLLVLMVVPSLRKNHKIWEQQQIFFDKKNVTSYGYVIVDIEIQ